LLLVFGFIFCCGMMIQQKLIEIDPIVAAINGIIKSNGTTISAALSGIDYAPATSGTAILKGSGSGGFSAASSGTDYEPAHSLDCRVTSQFDKTSDTNLANIPGLSATLVAGQTYTFEAVLFVTSGATGVNKTAVSGTCTATSIIYDSLRLITAGFPTLVRATALDTSSAGSTSGSVQILIRGTIVVNAGGTLTIQFAQNVSSANTSSVLVGSHMLIKAW